ncbi:TonB-dependent receptor [Catalinimonas sp. 4WD22]|uniref:TonB-dependent receptor domain-containing protein n=1 Tax=Catalinimonas locisalis TaxID=3133978 RepID=UPI0031019CFD
MKLFIYTTIALLSLNQLMYAQSSIQGSIHDNQHKGLAYANVLLRSQSDSVLVKGAVSDEEGHFSLADVPNGSYFIEYYMIGYTKTYSPPLEIQKKDLLSVGIITLAEDTQELDEVVIQASKPLYEMKMGKMVINVQSSITSAGLSAIDVLERSPGVFVNRQNNVFSLSGKEGVIVLMNGKRSRMPMEAVYQMLAGMNAGDIEKIEIMTVPPSKYDADGDAGFINIITKKGNGVVGTHGTFTGSLGHGSGKLANTSVSLNHQGRRLSVYVNYSLNYTEQLQRWRNQRESENDVESVSSLNISNRNTDRTTHNYQFGFDYLLGTNTIFSGLMSGYNNRFQMVAPTYSVFNYTLSTDTLIDLRMLETNRWKHLMGNINLQHTFPQGQVLNANLDYLTYNNANPSHYSNNYYAGDESLVREEENRITKDTPIDIWVAKLDYSINIGSSITLESGVKGTFSDLINDVAFEENKEGNWIKEPAYSSNANLTEDILAAFSSLKIEIDDATTLQAGLRYEHTNTYLESQEEGELVARNYGNFFPSLFLSRKLSKDHILQFSYGRRITRPTFNEMAPFVVFLDPYTFFSGNANILPTFTHNIKGDYAYKSFMFSLQYSMDKNVIMRFQPQIDQETNMLIFVSDNIDRRNTIAATFTLPFQVTPWWEMQNNLTANWQMIDTDLNGEYYQRTQKGFQANSTHTFRLPHKFTLELAGNYSSPVINGYFNWLARGFVNLGIQKEFNNNGSLRFSCNDIFETTQLRWKTHESASFLLDGRLKFEKRQFIITYTQKFGNNKVKGARQRSGASAAEQNRVTN